MFFSGIYIINLGKTWEKLQLAARIIVAIENPQDIIVQSARPYGQRAVLKFAQYTGAHAIAGRHTPGTFTNQMQQSYNEPRLLILTDPRTDHQVITPLEVRTREYLRCFQELYSSTLHRQGCLLSVGLKFVTVINLVILCLSCHNLSYVIDLCAAYQGGCSWKYSNYCFLRH